MESEAYLGIDISKEKLDVALLASERIKSKTFANDLEGYAKLLEWLRTLQLDSVHACMEATATYWEELAATLHENGLRVSVVNPGRIWGFRKSENIRNKTDKIDASLIARFCQALKPSPWVPPAPEYRQLKDIVRHVAALTVRLAEEKTRLKSGWLSPQVRRSVESHLKHLERQIETLKKHARALSSKHSKIRDQIALLQTIPGIGEDTASTIVAEVCGTGTFKSSRSLACYAGLAPRYRESGTSLKRKACLSKIGNKRLRRALYYPAVTVWRDRKIFSDFCDSMENRGKPAMVVIGALMRKLLEMSFILLKTERPWDPKLGGKILN